MFVTRQSVKNALVRADTVIFICDLLEDLPPGYFYFPEIHHF